MGISIDEPTVASTSTTLGSKESEEVNFLRVNCASVAVNQQPFPPSSPQLLRLLLLSAGSQQAEQPKDQ
jgi:hypothetical protein